MKKPTHRSYNALHRIEKETKIMTSCFHAGCLFLSFLFIVTFSYQTSNYAITRKSMPYY